MNLMKGKIVLITGSTKGIGKQTAIELAALGATVIIHARTMAEGEPVIQQLQIAMPSASFDLFVADFEKQLEVKKMALEITAAYNRLDILINNAALYEEWRRLSADTIERTFAVNHMAPFLLTHLLMPLLKSAARARIINISSQAHYQAKFDLHNLQGEKEYDGVNMYRTSKLCNLLFTYYLADKLKHQHIMVNAVHPGMIETHLYRNAYTSFEPDLLQDAADTVVYLASSGDVDGISGEYFTNRLPIQSSYDSYTKRYQKRLWAVSEHLAGIQSNNYIPAPKKSGKISWHVKPFFPLWMIPKSIKQKYAQEYSAHGKNSKGELYVY